MRFLGGGGGSQKTNILEGGGRGGGWAVCKFKRGGAWQERGGIVFEMGLILQCTL